MPTCCEEDFLLNEERKVMQTGSIANVALCPKFQSRRVSIHCEDFGQEPFQMTVTKKSSMNHLFILFICMFVFFFP